MTKKEILEQEVLLAARDLGIGTILFRNTLAKELKLNLTESLCLTLLGVKGPLSPSALSRLIGLSSGATTSMLDRLEQRGFLRRKDNEKDRRGIIIELKDDAGGEPQALVVEVQKAHRRLVEACPEGELRIVLRFLRNFTTNLADNSGDVRFLLGED